VSEPETLASIFARLGVVPNDRTPLEHREATNAAREAVWHAACQRGSCRYATDDVSQKDPPPVDSTLVCGGYHGTRTILAETGEVLWRWRPCRRHLEWFERRKVYARREREGQAALPTTPTRTLLDDESTSSGRRS
jgi:hypothetical protein